MNAKRIILTSLCALALSAVFPQKTLTIGQAHEMARNHYPAIAQYGIIEQTAHFNIANANKAYLPQGSLWAQATWQSDVTKVPVEIPNLAIPVPDKDQYKVVAEVSQLIWDGGKIAAQKQSLNANAEVEKQQLNSEVYSLGERVNNLFFGILLLDEQLSQQTILEAELQRNYNKVQSYIANGVANEADLSAVKVEQLKAGQQRVQLQSAREAYVKMLSTLVGEPIGADAVFEKPFAEAILSAAEINRPELNLFSAQEKLLESQRTLLKAKNMPVIGAFAQGGYGKPALNMFENKFAPFFVGGVRLSWNFGNLYTLDNELKTIDLQQKSVDVQRDKFFYNLNVQVPQQQIEIAKFRETMKDDDEIIRLRQLIKDAADAKVENGTMTVSDLLQEINALELAKQAKALHQIQYLMAIYSLKHTTGDAI